MQPAWSSELSGIILAASLAQVWGDLSCSKLDPTLSVIPSSCVLSLHPALGCCRDLLELWMPTDVISNPKPVRAWRSLPFAPVHPHPCCSPEPQSCEDLEVLGEPRAVYLLCKALGTWKRLFD